MFTRNNNFIFLHHTFVKQVWISGHLPSRTDTRDVPSISKLKNILRQLNISMLSTSKILLIRLNIVMKY